MAERQYGRWADPDYGRLTVDELRLYGASGDELAARRAPEVEGAAFRVLLKLHKETNCGKDGMHWAECETLAAALGWTSWEVWRSVVERLIV